MKLRNNKFFVVMVFILCLAFEIADIAGAQPVFLYDQPHDQLSETATTARTVTTTVSENSKNPVISNSEPAWTQQLIKKEDRSFNFGMVARGVWTEHRFLIRNPFEDTVHIASVSSSCSCTSAYVLEGKDEIQTYEKTAIVALFRTDLYEGSKNATITVMIDRPYRAEFQLNVRGEIRSDITAEPNFVKLDNIKEGEEVSRMLNIFYTGYNPAWKIVDFRSENEHISAKLLEIQPTPGRIVAKVRVTVDDKIPNGPFSDRLFFITNDSEGRREIPVLVQGAVGTVIRVTPETVFLGYLKPGEVSPLKSVSIRGNQPFRIKKIQCNNPQIEINYEPKEDAPPKVLYLVPVRYKNQLEGEGSPVDGKMRARVTIETDVPSLTPAFDINMAITEEKE
jgi:hypothetical protein